MLSNIRTRLFADPGGRNAISGTQVVFGTFLFLFGLFNLIVNNRFDGLLLVGAAGIASIGAELLPLRLKPVTVIIRVAELLLLVGVMILWALNGIWWPFVILGAIVAVVLVYIPINKWVERRRAASQNQQS